MSAMWPKGFVGNKWEVDPRQRCGSMPGEVNAANYLRRVSLGPSVGSTRVVPFQHA
jgi:hypothetical protein